MTDDPVTRREVYTPRLLWALTGTQKDLALDALLRDHRRIVADAAADAIAAAKTYRPPGQESVK